MNSCKEQERGRIKLKWYENRIKSAIDGTNPMVIKELSGSFAVYGDVQFLPGYCVLLPKREVASLNDLDLSERQIFLTDMTLLGDAIIQACSPLRINYELLGNTDNFLHAHLFPRYEWETDEAKKMPVWLYDKSHWTNPEYHYSEKRDGERRQKIASYLENTYR
ncbi:MAG TPA: hypothetical protein DIT57_07190 [Enterococcus sp.]|nr:hypothetical protein [Enterococcus sp.]